MTAEPFCPVCGTVCGDDCPGPIVLHQGRATTASEGAERDRVVARLAVLAALPECEIRAIIDDAVTAYGFSAKGLDAVTEMVAANLGAHRKNDA